MCPGPTFYLKLDISKAHVQVIQAGRMGRQTKGNPMSGQNLISKFSQAELQVNLSVINRKPLWYEILNHIQYFILFCNLQQANITDYIRPLRTHSTSYENA